MKRSSIQAAAPHDIENPNPYMQLGARMMEELEMDKPSPVHPLRCIFRVPHRLRCEPGKAVHYTPQVISIGPLHHENPALKAMEEHKKQYLQYFMGRTKHLSLMHYIKKIKDQEARLRSCYSETIYPDSDKFVKIILVDAIFIIEFLFRNWYPALLDENDYIFGKPGMIEDIWPDLLMLENQLPFFILVDLFDPDIFPIPSEYSKRLKGVERLSILFLSLYFSDGVPTFGGRSDDLKTICCSEVKHFVDLLRKLCIAPMLKGQYQGQSKHTTESMADVGQQSGHMIADELVCHLCVNVHDEVGANVYELVRGHKSLSTSVSLGADELEGDILEDDLDGAAMPLGTNELEGADLIVGAAAPLGTNELAQPAKQSKYTIAPSIVKLHLAGVEFENQSTKNLFDIRFKHGILKIPKFKVEDKTELILRNLVAFEQCAFITQKININKSAFEECYISDYVGIMNQFVDTAKDVELLVQNEIFENLLGGGDDALSTMINSISNGVIPTNLVYGTLSAELNKFCSIKWNKNKANLRQNYFKNPWETINFVYGIVLILILTLIQTICSIISL